MNNQNIEQLKEKSEYWEPQPRQLLFLQSPAYEALYGGAKGGGKTDALLAESTRQIHNPRYKAAIFRRETPRLEEIIDRSRRWFNKIAKYNQQKRVWTFPSGAKVMFFHCEKEKDKEQHQGKEYQYIAFDQIEEFTESQYDYIKGACRTSDPDLICYIRATANPGNIGHAWVKAKFIDPLEPNGQIKYFKRINDEDTEVPAETQGAQSRAFVFAKVFDNPALLSADPNYLPTLQNLPRALRLAFLEGNWDAFEGQYFSEWRKQSHVITYQTFKEEIEHLQINRFLSLDYGYAKPASVHFHAVLPEAFRTYREIYDSGMDYESLGNEIIRHLEDGVQYDYLVCDPAIQGDKSHHQKDAGMKDGDKKGESGLDVLRKILAPYFPVVLGDNRRVIGWTRMHEYLKREDQEKQEIDPYWKVTGNCKKLIETLPNLTHSKINPEDVDTDCEDHAPDDCRYAIMSRPQIPSMVKKKLTSKDRFWNRVKLDIKRKGVPNNPLQHGEVHDYNEDIGSDETIIPDG